MSRPVAHQICKRNALAPRNLTALRSDQLRRWPWPVSATQSGSPVTARGGRESGINAAWLTAAMTGQILLAWLKLLALDGDLAKAEPKTLRYACCTPPPAWSAAAGNGA